MASGCELAAWYVDEALRLSDAYRQPPGLRNAIRLLDWLRAKGKRETSVREIMQFGPSPVRRKAKPRRRSPCSRNTATLRARATDAAQGGRSRQRRRNELARVFDIDAIMRDVRAAANLRPPATTATLLQTSPNRSNVAIVASHHAAEIEERAGLAADRVPAVYLDAWARLNHQMPANVDGSQWRIALPRRWPVS